jgi:two-component system CheB/CheR fusion protein
MSEGPFWTLFTALPVGAVLFDLEEDGFVEFNDAACAQLGYSREAFAHLRIGDIDAMRSGEEITRARRQIKPGSKPQRFHTRQRAADGSFREVDVTLQCIVLAGKTLGYAVWHDVTERENAVEKLRAREAELARVQRIGRIGGFDVDLQAGFANNRSPEYLRLHQLTDESIHEPHEAWVQRLHPEDRERMVRRFADAVAGPSCDYAAEYRVVTPKGEVRWISAVAEIERDAEGRPLRMVGAHIDVSALRQAESQLASHAARLEEADRRKDEFLAILGHELRNPLAPILSVSQWLRRKAEGLAPEVVAAHEVIERQGRHLKVLVDELLDVARVTTGRITLNREVVDLGSVVLAAVEQVQDFMSRQEHRFELELPQSREMPQQIYVHGDLARLVQVVSNLLNNAAKYTDPGGRVQLSVTTEGDQALVVVQDSGIGIPAASLTQIFDPLSKGARPDDPTRGGLGIGLSLAQRIAELHGGRLVACSDGPGKGSRFTLSLPQVHLSATMMVPEAARAPAGASAISSGSAVAPRREGPSRILIVDDNVDAAESMAVLLQMDGHEVLVLHDGNGLVEHALEYRPDVVLLDLGLPGRDGLQLARDLRGTPALMGLKLIAVTGYGQAQDRRRTHECGFDHHLIKPVDYRELCGLMDSPQGPAQA